MKNQCGKMRKIYNPYEIWVTPNLNWKWFVLKKYKSPDGEAKDRYARWMCAVTSPIVGNNPDYGDVYRNDVIHNGFQLLGYIYDNVHYCFECGERLERNQKFFVHHKIDHPIISELSCICCEKQLIDVQPTKKTVERLLEE